VAKETHDRGYSSGGVGGARTQTTLSLRAEKKPCSFPFQRIKKRI